MSAKQIEFDRITRDFNAYYETNYIGSFPSYHAAECAINEHVLDLCTHGLIDTPLAALAAQALRSANPLALDPPDGPPAIDEESEPIPASDSAVRAHLTYGHLRRDLFAPVLFCACGERATIVVYGNPDVFACDRCHAACDPDEQPQPWPDAPRVNWTS